ncbi:ABC transporter permease subunit [Methylorubrum sp. SB2]|uniref:ABC transporter permease n=1 Tax=Methylorubrum subtropicum TaxID=3138812 RepID=UPI00313B8D43
MVALAAAAGALALALTLDRFATAGNLFALLRSISVVGILALGMALVVMGRNIDLSQVAVALISTGAVAKMLAAGVPLPVALLGGAGLALAMGAVNAGAATLAGIPPLFATLATAMLFVGLARSSILPGASIHLPADAGWLAGLGGSLGGVPVPPLVLAACAVLTHLFLERTVPGRFVRAAGINPRTAAVVGLPVLRTAWLQYLVSALAAFVAGLIMLSSSGLVDLQLANSTLIFDVLLVVVLGGVGLSGGRGGIFGVMAATILVGLMMNAMTILDVGSQMQSIAKGLALLLVLLADGVLRRGEAPAAGI